MPNLGTQFVKFFDFIKMETSKSDIKNMNMTEPPRKDESQETLEMGILKSKSDDIRNYGVTSSQSSNTEVEIDVSNCKTDESKGDSSKWWQKVKTFWNHPAGPMTIFFWAPALKWGLVIAGLSDLQRPAEKLSALQTIALLATGIIWCRYSIAITPKNYSLFSVNLFIALTQSYQFYRSIKYQYFSSGT